MCIFFDGYRYFVSFNEYNINCIISYCMIYSEEQSELFFVIEKIIFVLMCFFIQILILKINVMKIDVKIKILKKKIKFFLI